MKASVQRPTFYGGLKLKSQEPSFVKCLVCCGGSEIETQENRNEERSTEIFRDYEERGHRETWNIYQQKIGLGIKLWETKSMTTEGIERRLQRT